MSTLTTRLAIMRGDTLRYDIRITDADAAALDLTGLLGAWFTVKYSRRDPDASKLLQKTLGAGIEVIDALDGTLRLTLTATETAALNASRAHVWDFQVMTAAGDIITPDYLTGPLYIEGDVTRAVAA